MLSLYMGVLSQQLLLFWYHTWSLQNDKCKKLFKCAQCKNIILRTFYLKKHLGTHKQKIICLQQLRQGIHWIAFSVSWVLVPTTFYHSGIMHGHCKIHIWKKWFKCVQCKNIIVKIFYLDRRRKTSSILFLWSLLRHGVYLICKFGDANKKFINFKGLNVFCRQKN